MTDIVVFLGPGRSGTSVMSQLLQRFVGHELQSQIPGDRNNARGYFEPRFVVELHDRLLNRTNITPNPLTPDVMYEASELNALREWLAQNRNPHGATVVKDPRTVHTFPVWARVAEELDLSIGVIHMVRPVSSFVESSSGFRRSRLAYVLGQLGGELAPRRHQRELMSLADSWTNLHLMAVRRSRGYPRVFVSYEALLADPVVQLRRTTESLSLIGQVGTDLLATAGLVDQGLRRSTGTSASSILRDLGAARIREALSNALEDACIRRESDLPRVIDSPLVDQLVALYAEYWREGRGTLAIDRSPRLRHDPEARASYI